MFKITNNISTVEFMNTQVRVILLTIFREIVGKKEIIVEVSTKSMPSLKDLLDELANRYGRDFQKIVEPKTGVISSEFIVSVNNVFVTDTGIKLNTNDIIMIGTPVGGG